jgi:hypothetical protein
VAFSAAQVAIVVVESEIIDVDENGGSGLACACSAPTICALKQRRLATP